MNGEDVTKLVNTLVHSGQPDAAPLAKLLGTTLKAGAANPAGRSYHAAFGPPEKLMVFDVWASQAAFDKFGKTLMPIMQEIGVDPGQPSVMPMHNVVVPAKKAARAKLAKKSSKRRKR